MAQSAERKQRQETERSVWTANATDRQEICEHRLEAWSTWRVACGVGSESWRVARPQEMREWRAASDERQERTPGASSGRPGWQASAVRTGTWRGARP